MTKKVVDFINKCIYNKQISYEWDEKKRLSNIKKHGVDFKRAVSAIEDPLCYEIIQFVNGEERVKCIGSVSNHDVFVVVYKMENENVKRIISSWPATKKERWAYENGYEV
ncbi:MAG: BrnT family toxin [Clostridiales Family XIII bacterium]|jgi:uncharacterized DUF497 family protein|nr:BrnT family toxin [Clostridiales Family XIII bacterium]